MAGPNNKSVTSVPSAVALSGTTLQGGLKNAPPVLGKTGKGSSSDDLGLELPDESSEADVLDLGIESYDDPSGKKAGGFDYTAVAPVVVKETDPVKIAIYRKAILQALIALTYFITSIANMAGKVGLDLVVDALAELQAKVNGLCLYVTGSKVIDKMVEDNKPHLSKGQAIKIMENYWSLIFTLMRINELDHSPGSLEYKERHKIILRLAEIELRSITDPNINLAGIEWIIKSAEKANAGSYEYGLCSETTRDELNKIKLFLNPGCNRSGDPYITIAAMTYDRKIRESTWELLEDKLTPLTKRFLERFAEVAKGRDPDATRDFLFKDGCYSLLKKDTADLQQDFLRWTESANKSKADKKSKLSRPAAVYRDAIETSIVARDEGERTSSQVVTSKHKRRSLSEDTGSLQDTESKSGDGSFSEATDLSENVDSTINLGVAKPSKSISGAVSNGLADSKTTVSLLSLI